MVGDEGSTSNQDGQTSTTLVDDELVAIGRTPTIHEDPEVDSRPAPDDPAADGRTPDDPGANRAVTDPPSTDIARRVWVGEWISRLVVVTLLGLIGWVTAITWAAVTTAAPVIHELTAEVEAVGGALATTTDWWSNRPAYHEACHRLCGTAAGSTVMYLHLIGLLMPPVWLASALASVVALALSRPERWAVWSAAFMLFVAFHLPRFLYENTWLALLAVME